MSLRKNAEGKEGPSGIPIFPWTPGLEAQWCGADQPNQMTVVDRNSLLKRTVLRCCPRSGEARSVRLRGTV